MSLVHPRSASWPVALMALLVIVGQILAVVLSLGVFVYLFAWGW